MQRKNLFDGESYYAIFARIAYTWLMSHKWVTYADIMADYLRLKSYRELPCCVSKCNNYGELKKAFRDIRHAIIEKVGDGCFEEKGNNRNRSFHYKGSDKDPLEDMRNAKVINDLKQYWKFCQDSAGFFPFSWLKYFFEDSRDLLEIKTKRDKGEQVLSVSLDRKLENIDLLPFLYNAINTQRVLSVNYKPYNEECVSLTFHPQFLKEFNGRWFLFGHVEDAPSKYPEDACNLAIDRIVEKPREIDNKLYVGANAGYYSDFFKNIIGVTHTEDKKVYVIHVRAHDIKIFKLTETKPIHTSQKTIVPFGEHDDGVYGEFSVEIEMNNEFISQILRMGAGLEIVSPDEVRDIFKQRVENLSKLYK